MGGYGTINKCLCIETFVLLSIEEEIILSQSKLVDKVVMNNFQLDWMNIGKYLCISNQHIIDYSSVMMTSSFSSSMTSSFSSSVVGFDIFEVLKDGSSSQFV